MNDHRLLKDISFLFLFVQPPLRFSYSFQPIRIINLPVEDMESGEEFLKARFHPAFIARLVFYEKLLLIITNTALKIHLIPIN